MPLPFLLLRKHHRCRLWVTVSKSGMAWKVYKLWSEGCYHGRTGMRETLSASWPSAWVHQYVFCEYSIFSPLQLNKYGRFACCLIEDGWCQRLLNVLQIICVPPLRFEIWWCFSFQFSTEERCVKDLSMIAHCLIISNLWLKAFLCFLACCCKAYGTDMAFWCHLCYLV